MNKERQLGNVTATDPLLKNSIPLLDNVSSKRRSLCLDSLRVPLPHIDNASPPPLRTTWSMDRPLSVRNNPPTSFASQVKYRRS